MFGLISVEMLVSHKRYPEQYWDTELVFAL
jgi:hypothetical protein